MRSCTQTAARQEYNIKEYLYSQAYGKMYVELKDSPKEPFKDREAESTSSKEVA